MVLKSNCYIKVSTRAEGRKTGFKLVLADPLIIEFSLGIELKLCLNVLPGKESGWNESLCNSTSPATDSTLSYFARQLALWEVT